MAFHQTQKLPFLLDAFNLYCEEEEEQGGGEEHWGQPETEALCSIEEDEELNTLFSKETENDVLFNVVEKNSDLAKARKESIEWILKVSGYYSFSPHTSLLAVNYLDRFFSGLESQTQQSWMSQLAAVACLSLAAKVEETYVPLLLDFQVEEAKYVFEAKTIQRMELLILSNLQWKMNPVTPFSFLDYIARKLELKTHLCSEFLRRCEGVLLSVISDCRFLSYLPSVMASATMLHVISRLVPGVGEESREQLMGIIGIHKEKVEECHKVMKEVGSRIDIESGYKRKIPGSPKGVMEVSFSSESSEDSWAMAASSSSSVSSSPEPLSKKTRIMSPQDHQIHYS